MGTTESTTGGLTYPKEDGFFTAQYLAQLIQLDKYIEDNYDALIDDPLLSRDQFAVGRPISQKFVEIVEPKTPSAAD